jgi:hypothetical protein
MTAYYGPALDAEIAYRRERLQAAHLRVPAPRRRHLLRRLRPVR